MSWLSSIENVAKSGWDSVKHAAGDAEHAGESAWNNAVAEAKQAGRQLSDPNSLMSQLGHTALDTVGMVPVVGSVAEGVNAGWYAAQGDYGDALLSAASAIPIVGDAADAARLTRDGIGLARDGETIVRDVHDGETIVKDVRGAETVSKDAHAVEAATPRPSSAGPPDPVRTGGGGGDAGGPPEAPDRSDGGYPTGLAYRSDLPQHLAGPDGFTSSGTLHGTHNLDNATAALESRGAHQVPELETGQPGYTMRPTDTDGISEIRYQVRDPATGTLRRGAKTVYDPAVHSDQSMLQSAQKAGAEAFGRYTADPSSTRFNVTQDGINFRAYINFDRPTGAPYVGNVHPVK